MGGFMGRFSKKIKRQNIVSKKSNAYRKRIVRAMKAFHEARTQFESQSTDDSLNEENTSDDVIS